MVAAAIVLIAAAVWWLRRPAEPQRPNLLLITIDTLRADRVGVYGSGSGATPTLDALAARGVRFDQAQTAVPLTGPSHATIFTGLYPPVHGVRGNVVFALGSQYPTLATLLKGKGYDTGAFVGAYPVAAAFGFAQGFDVFDEAFHPSSASEPGAERPANEVADSAIRWLTATDRGNAPFFMWAHFFDPHAPYAPPSPYKESFAGRPYEGEIAFTDAHIGRLLTVLRDSGRDRNTIVMVLADHGEGLGDHRELSHAVLIYQSTMRVPFIISGPGVPGGRVVPARVGTIDVLPTALGLLGFEHDPALIGRDLMPLMNGRTLQDNPLYQESLFGRLNCHWAALRGWAQGDWKLIAGAQPELYNLANDPDERHDLAATEPDRVARMTAELRRAMQQLAPRGDRARPVAITAEQEARLRSLGYAAGSGGGGDLDAARLPDPRTRVELYDRLQAAAVAHGPALAKAFADVRTIVGLDPDNPFAFGTLASLEYRHGNLAAAVRAFARTLELDPDRPGVRQNYGKLLREVGRYDESERELRVALEQTTQDDSRTRVNLAATLIETRKTSEAESLVDAVLQREPRNPEAHAVKGQLLLATGKAREALPHFEQAAQASDPDAMIALARAALAAGDVAKAREVAASTLRRNPGHPWALAVLGHAVAVAGEREAATAYLRRAFEIRPRRPAVWESLAEGFDAVGDTRRASECRREAAAFARDRARAH
jgi:arylsulfatase A-like enzyme/predicted Zn-dependent protease